MLGETCKLTLILGGVYLIVRKVIDWRIPVFFIATAFILFWIQTGVIYSVESGTDNALYQILSGGLLLGAFFMATDYVTSPVSKWGKAIMGIGCAVILFVIRAYNNSYPEGCSFAILFMNVLTPLIDKWTMPRTFGAVKPAKAKKSEAKQGRCEGMKNKSLFHVFTNGLLNENPTFRLLLGMCPTLAISTAASSGVGMGLATTFVLVFSNMVISMLRHIIPERVRIPGVHRCYCHFRDDHRPDYQGISAFHVRYAGHLYPVDRGQLHHLCPRGILCFQKPGASFGI